MRTQAEQDVIQDRRNLHLWMLRTPYGDAKRAFHRGIISEDAWTCYLVLWAYSAPRFSTLAESGRYIVARAIAEAAQ